MSNNPNNQHTLDLMIDCNFWEMVDRRESRIASILDLPPKWFYNTEYFNDLLMVELKPTMNVYDVFDETNAAIGEDWLWANNKFYFVRESDALWFTLRWR